MPVDAVLGNIADIVNAVDLPVNADFESGYADDPDGVAANVRRCVATGVAGLSIEDATGDRARPLHELPQAVERLAAARAAIDESGAGVLLTARAECFLVGHEDPLRESIRRLTAYAAGGRRRPVRAGHLPARRIRSLTGALAPKPVNVLVGRNTGLTVADLAALGVRRISVGSALARAAWTRFMEAAKDIAAEGRFTSLDGLTPFADLNAFFKGLGNQELALRPLQRVQKSDQIRLLAARETDREPGVVKVQDLVECRRRSVVEIRRAGREGPENRTLELADVVPPARHHRPARDPWSSRSRSSSCA